MAVGVPGRREDSIAGAAQCTVHPGCWIDLQRTMNTFNVWKGESVRHWQSFKLSDGCHACQWPDNKHTNGPAANVSNTQAYMPQDMFGHEKLAHGDDDYAGEVTMCLAPESMLKYAKFS